jgi:hypothetical protein
MQEFELAPYLKLGMPLDFVNCANLFEASTGQVE